MKKTGLLAACLLLISGGVVFANQFEMMGLNFLAPTVSDRNSVLNPVEGEIVYERTISDAGFWGYTNSSWIPLGGAGVAVPTGTVMPFAGATAPAGYMLADGSAVSRSTYSALFAVVGTSFGSGDGSTTFNLPDLRGRFVRGVDDGAGRDPNAATRTAMATGGNTGDNVGSVQDDELKSHSHSTPQGLSSGGGFGFPSGSAGLGSTSGSTGGSETRPKNIYLNYIVKL